MTATPIFDDFLRSRCGAGRQSRFHQHSLNHHLSFSRILSSLALPVTQAIYIAAKLGVADLLKDSAKSSEELAAATAVDSQSLYRVLRALASIGIFAESENGKFTLTPLAQYLRSDVPDSLRAIATMYGGENWHWQPWGEILFSVKTGKPAFEQIFGVPVFSYFAQSSAAAIFDEAMTNFSSKESNAITSSYDFSGIKTLVDVGGGHGGLLAAILQVNPTLKRILYNSPRVIAGANQHLNQFNGRCEAVGGDFFEFVPSGGDAYMMKHIVHDWDDARAIAILKNCYDAMPENGKLLVFESVIPAGNEPDFGKFLDIEMLVMTSGRRERTAVEFDKLFVAAGFKLTNIIFTPSPISIIENIKA